jgi:hypothetical protein
MCADFNLSCLQFFFCFHEQLHFIVFPLDGVDNGSNSWKDALIVIQFVVILFCIGSSCLRDQCIVVWAN